MSAIFDDRVVVTNLLDERLVDVNFSAQNSGNNFADFFLIQYLASRGMQIDANESCKIHLMDFEVRNLVQPDGGGNGIYLRIERADETILYIPRFLARPAQSFGDRFLISVSERGLERVGSMYNPPPWGIFLHDNIPILPVRDDIIIKILLDEPVQVLQIDSIHVIASFSKNKNFALITP